MFFYIYMDQFKVVTTVHKMCVIIYALIADIIAMPCSIKLCESPDQ
jgi:hypothetical protein